MIARPELQSKQTTVKVMVKHIGQLAHETTSAGNRVQRATVIVADETAALQAVFDSKVINKAQKAMDRNTALRY